MNLNNLSKRQLRVIAEALDLYSRVLAGQLREVGRVVERKKRDYDAEVEGAIDVVKTRLFPELPPSASYGIGSPDLHEDAKVAYEVFKVIDIHLHPDALINQGNILRVTDPVYEDLPVLEV